jgi:hypothetical protein
MKPNDEEDARKLEGYCKEFASSFTLDKGMWYERDNLLKNFPLTEYDLSGSGNAKSFREFKTDEGTWFIRIADVLKKDQTPPLAFIRDKIVKAIIEKRRLLLVEKIYDRIYQDGIRTKSFEVLVK